MAEPKTKRSYEQETLIIPGLRLEPSDPARTNSKPSDKRSSRYDDLALQDREKLVNRLIDHLKGL
ncbi:hypothetical protein FDZ74_01585 [bacterium]|nr:MAG: hypothetical protein FDZ74_01585 [bacterium]